MMMNRVLLACLAVASIATIFAAPVHDVEEVVPEQVLTAFGRSSGESTFKHDDDTENEVWEHYKYDCDYDLDNNIRKEDAKHDSIVAEANGPEVDTDKEAEKGAECNRKLEGQVKAQVAEQEKEMAKLQKEQEDATPLYTCHEMCGIFHEKATCDKCAEMAKEDEETADRLRKKRMAAMKKYMEKNKKFYDKMSEYAHKDHDKFMNAVSKKFGHRFKNRAKKYLSKAKKAVMEKQREAKKAKAAKAAKETEVAKSNIDCDKATGNQLKTC